MSAAQLDALERAMGVVSVSGVDGEVFDGEIEPDDEEVVGRTAVDYGDGDDPLFSSPGGGGGGAAPLGLDPNSFIALISQLECMAEQIEAESGEPEVGIRGQIATLRAVLQGQRAAVEEQAERLATAAGEGAVALAEAEASAALQRIEENLARMSETLAADVGAAELVGSLLRSNREMVAELVAAGSCPAGEREEGEEASEEAGEEADEEDVEEIQGRAVAPASERAAADRAGSADWGPTQGD